MKRTLVSLFVAAGLLIGAVAPAMAQAQPDPAAVVQRLVDAVNRKDWSGGEALFTPNAIAVGGPCPDTCIGGSTIVLQGIMPPPEEVGATLRVQMLGTPVVSGNTVTVRLEVRFGPFPQPDGKLDTLRLVQLNSFLIQDDKIAGWSAVDDVADPGTQALVRQWAMPGTQGGSGDPNSATVPTARDGQALHMQPTATRLAFIASYGPDADERWVAQHNEELARQGR